MARHLLGIGVSLLALSCNAARPRSSPTPASAPGVAATRASLTDAAFGTPLTDSTGEEVRLSALLKGRTAVVDIWASWCGPCRNWEPRLRRLNELYGDMPGFSVVGISIDKELAAAAAHARAHGLTWHQLHAPGGFKNPLLAALKVDGIPAVYVVRADGRVQPVRHVADVDDVGAELLGIPNAWALNAGRPSKAACAERYGDADKMAKSAAMEHWTYSRPNPRTNHQVRTEVFFDRDGRLANAATRHVYATPAKIKVTVSRGALERVLKEPAGGLGKADAAPAIELGVEATDRWGQSTISLRRLKADAGGQSYSCDFELAGTRVARLVLRRPEKKLDFVQLGVSLSFGDREVLDVDLDEMLNPTPQRQPS